MKTFSKIFFIVMLFLSASYGADNNSSEFAQLKGTVWFDENVNGLQDANETNLTIEGIQVHLFKNGEDTGEMQKTDENGTYLFENLEPDNNYSIKVDKPKNYTDFTFFKKGHNDDIDSDVRSDGYSYSVTLKAGEIYDKIDAGLVCKCVAWLHLEKTTNGVDADFSKGPSIKTGSEVEWKYTISNPSRFRICDINLTDDKEGNISCPQECLDSLEEMVCIKKGVAIEGEYENLATVTGKCAEDNDNCANDGNVTNDDPSHYFGANPKIDLEKYTNGKDSDTAPGEKIDAGKSVTWEYNVTNIGNVKLSNIKVTDDKEGEIECPKTELDVNETMTCVKTATAKEGHYENIATVTASSEVGDVNDTDLSHYYGVNVGGDERTCLGNYMWLDENLNGVQDEGEPGVIGVKVELYDANGTKIGVTKTDKSGKYKFCGLKGGNYRVKFDLPKTYLFTLKNQGDPLHDSNVDSKGWSEIINLKPDEQNMTIDAGIYCSCDDYLVHPKNYKSVSAGFNILPLILMGSLFASIALLRKRV